MKIIIQEPPRGEEESIVVNVRRMNENLMRAIDMLKNPGALVAYNEGEAVFVQVGDIFYVESTAQRTFVYTEEQVYQSKLKLYEVESKLSESDFLRVSRQVIVNIRKIKSIQPAGDGRLSAKLLNGEKVGISRQYVPELKERFGL